MESLDNLRNSLDDVDRQILELFAKRFAIVEKVGKIKKENKLPFFDQARWELVQASRQQMSKYLGLDQEFTSKILDLIHAEALRLENTLKS